MKQKRNRDGKKQKVLARKACRKAKDEEQEEKNEEEEEYYHREAHCKERHEYFEI